MMKKKKASKKCKYKENYELKEIENDEIKFIGSY